jgi:F-type H+-transporting ATPase subunit a
MRRRHHPILSTACLGLALALVWLVATQPALAQTATGEHHTELSTEHSAEPGGEHAAEHHGQHLELPNLTMLLKAFVLHPGTLAYRYVEVFENAFFALLSGAFLCLVAWRVYRRRSVLPGRLQAFVEMIVEWLEGLASTMMGPKYGRHFTPFIATLFVYIATMNCFVLIPLGKSPTSTFLNNISIAVVVFLYVQYTGIKRQGLLGYLHHLAGSPKDLAGWCLSPLLFALELFGEFVKPFSLSLRLFGNIFGEDLLLAVFALLGVVVLSPLHSPVGLPLHVPFYFLALLLGLIQALVFSLLSTVYISLMLPHGEHASGH